jgi:hypothetical protein
VAQLESIFGAYVRGEVHEDERHLALDGKTLKNSAQDTVPAVHLLSLFLTKAEGVISQIRMDNGENEITTALRLIEMTDIEGKIVTGDAMFSQKKFAN